jgi:ribonuclease HII
MKNAVSSLKIKPEIILVDGNHKIPDLDINQEAIVDGDAKSACIACASILAKVTRDRLMYQYAKEFPQYLFEDHKGYGTKMHMQAIREYGLTPIHRRSFTKNILHQ